MRERVRRNVKRLMQLTAPDPIAEERRLATSPPTKIALRQFFLSIQRAVAEGRPLPALRDCGFRVFSQDDEDGLLLYLLAVVGIGTRQFVDIGAGNCVTASNCANLALNLGFHGLFVDADPQRIDDGRAFYASHTDTAPYPPKAVCAFATRENVNDLIRGAGIEGPIDVLSIDIDGNDHWIWRGIDAVQASIVVIETHTEYGLDDIESAYRPDFDWRKLDRDAPLGASAVAMSRIGAELGYRLVGCNRYGFNAIFLRNGVAEDVVPTVGPEALLQHAWSRETT